MTTFAYLAAGLSSRFGGNVKGLVKVGENEETLLEISMKQAKEAGAQRFIFVVSKQTEKAIKEVFGDFFEGIPISYTFQNTPEWRKKPFGTAHAFLSVRNLVNGPFILLNADDLYGKESFKALLDALSNNQDMIFLSGYKLSNVLPEEGTVNRGIITHDDGIVKGIKETLSISREDIPLKFSGEELASMNLFGFNADFFPYVQDKFIEFVENSNDSDEFMLPTILDSYIKDIGTKVLVLSTNDIPLGITNPGDEERLRQQLGRL